MLLQNGPVEAGPRGPGSLSAPVCMWVNSPCPPRAVCVQALLQGLTEEVRGILAPPLPGAVSTCVGSPGSRVTTLGRPGWSPRQLGARSCPVNH